VADIPVTIIVPIRRQPDELARRLPAARAGSLARRHAEAVSLPSPRERETPDPLNLACPGATNTP
jgi:hypothetical protein